MKVLGHITNGNSTGVFVVINTTGYNGDGRYDIHVVETFEDDSNDLLGFNTTSPRDITNLDNPSRNRGGSIMEMEVGEMTKSNTEYGVYLIRVK